MSFEASAWAVKAAVSRSATKNLLMILAHITNDETGELYPSLGYLEAHTGLSRKTVIACMQELESPEVGVLIRTGEMKGRTGQIPVYQFVRSKLVPVIKKGTGGKFHRSKPENETGSFLPGKGGVFPDETVVKTPPGIEKGNREEEYIPLSLTGECPCDDEIDLLGGLPTVDERSVPLVDYVIEGWKQLVVDCPKIAGIRALNESRRKGISARANEFIKGSHAKMTPHQVWDQIFAAIRGSEFLRGEAEPGRGYSKSFTLDIDYMLRPKIFLSTLDKAANDEEHNRVTSNPETGRRFGPAEQAGREAWALYVAGKERCG